MDKQVNLIADTIVYAVQNQKSQVLGLLLKNGVVVPSGTSDAKIIVAVSDTFKKSKPFRKEFIDLIGKSEYVSSGSFDGYANANGFVYDTTFDPTDPLFGSLQTTVAPKATTTATTAPKTSFWSSENIMALINKGADVYTVSTTNQANKALADAATARAQAGIVDVNSGSNVSPSQNTGSNTAVYVVVGVVGIALVGGLIWYFTKPKN